jgi:integrase
LPLIPRRELRTVQDLLTAIQELRSDLQVPMLKTTAGHVSHFLNTPLDRLSIAALVDIDLAPRFRDYLSERRYKRDSIRSYSNFLAILRRTAQELGWEPPDVPEDWKPILTAMQTHPRCSSIVRYAIRQGKTPFQFCNEDLNAWGQTLLDQGRSYRYTMAAKRSFRLALIRSGLAEQLPKLRCNSERPSPYGVPLLLFPTQLRREVEALLNWKQDVYSEGRPWRGRLRTVSAKHLESCISRLYGFVTKVEQRKDITKLVQLVTKTSVVSFLKWSLNERRLKGEPLAGNLGLLCAAMRWNPAYRAYDFGWFRTLLSEIQPDSESEKQERKASKYLPYEVVDDMPRMIHERREELVKKSKKQLSLLVRDELLISWLVTLVWRQRNIRECRLGHNLFKAEVQPMVNIAVPYWAQERLRANPHEKFWQFHFREGETKTHREVRAILPRRLVPLLEEYLEHYRPILLMGSDPTNLFLNGKGRPLTDQGVNDRVSNLTVHYAHRRVTPHLFRDIFAFYWLRNHPRDYLMVSKALWHTNIQTTIRIYGSKFDESHAMCQVEEWLDRRREGIGAVTHAADGRVDVVPESHSTRAQVRPRIQPQKAPSSFRKTGSGRIVS